MTRFRQGFAGQARAYRRQLPNIEPPSAETLRRLGVTLMAEARDGGWQTMDELDAANICAFLDIPLEAESEYGAWVGEGLA
jgi:hypothetical protein